MLILGLSGSPRSEGNTDFLVHQALAIAETVGATTEFISLGRARLGPCVACDVCKKTGNCPIDDDMPEILAKIRQADGMIIGSPVYFGSMSAQTKMFIDRTRPLRTHFELVDKVGGAISVGGARNGGQELVIRQLHDFFLIHGALVISDGERTSHFGGIAVGQKKGDAEPDSIGITTVENLARNMVRVIRKIRSEADSKHSSNSL
jgi:multimeric flavodoxin WrbA